MAVVKTLASAFIVLAASISAYGGPMAARARYEAVLPENPNPRQVRTLEIAVSPCSEQDGFGWCRLIGTKIGGESYKVWFLADGDPFVAGDTEGLSFRRYILQEPNQAPVEYVDGHTGRALAPLFGFVEELLPRAEVLDSNGLFSEGSYLGHPLVRREVLEPVEIEPPGDVVRLVFRTDLIVGTSRNFRDDGKGRKSSKDNYSFVPFTRENYDEMIEAGINYFTAKGEQVNWICRRPVFYDGYSPEIAFPEELYRPNFLGLRMFLDEPACRLAGKYPPGASLQTAVEMIHEHIREKLANASYRTLLRSRGIDTGTLSLIEPEIPIWETYIGTSYYQLEANPVGIVQECRWRIDPNADSQQILMLQRVNEEFGVDIPVTPENLFTWFYSQMRGPARAFGTKWGMSIYGQAEPHLRFPSMKLAYDMGAEFIWFWTSDHDHHVTYTEQLSLARQISEYAESQPRRDLDALRRAADVAVVLPYGYTLPTVWQMFTWGTHIYPLDRENEHGITYKQVLTPAVAEIARCLKTGRSYDVVPAGEKFDPRGYKRVFRVLADGTDAEIAGLSEEQLQSDRIKYANLVAAAKLFVAAADQALASEPRLVALTAVQRRMNDWKRHNASQRFRRYRADSGNSQQADKMFSRCRSVFATKAMAEALADPNQAEELKPVLLIQSRAHWAASHMRERFLNNLTKHGHTVFDPNDPDDERLWQSINQYAVEENRRLEPLRQSMMAKEGIPEWLAEYAGWYTFYQGVFTWSRAGMRYYTPEYVREAKKQLIEAGRATSPAIRKRMRDELSAEDVAAVDAAYEYKSVW